MLVGGLTVNLLICQCRADGVDVRLILSWRMELRRFPLQSFSSLPQADNPCSKVDIRWGYEVGRIGNVEAALNNAMVQFMRHTSRIRLLMYQVSSIMLCECFQHLRGVNCRCIMYPDQFLPCPGAVPSFIEVSAADAAHVVHDRDGVHVRTQHLYNPRWYSSFCIEGIEASTLPLLVWTLCWDFCKKQK